jgi:hypothetical protein
MSKHPVLSLCTLLVAAALTVVGCSSDKSSIPEISLSLDRDSTGVEICATLSITADMEEGEASEVDWYVNGALGGGTAQGAITQTNPATYSAPDIIPAQATVVVRAVSREDTTKTDSCRVTVKLTVIHVSAGTGSDATGTGCVTRPFKSISHAVDVAPDGMTVLAAPGVYDEANGESFPIELFRGLSLVGESRETTIIRMTSGPGAALGVYEDSPAIRCFTLDQGPAPGPQWTYVVYVNTGTTNALLDSLIVHDRAINSVVRVAAATNTTIRNCQFTAEGNPERTCLALVSGDSGTVVRNCEISGFIEGIFMNGSEQGSSDALIEGCTIENNAYGVNMCCYASDTSNPHPDLGGGPRGSLGGNVIRGSSMYGLRNPGNGTVYAKYNTWDHTPPTIGPAEGSDIYNEGTGSVIWE